MTMHVRSQLGNADHRHNGDDGNLWFGPFGYVGALASTHFLPTQKHAPTQNTSAFDAQRVEVLPVHEPIAPQSVPTIPIAHQHNPAVSYLEPY